MSNSELIGVFIGEELVPDISEHAFMIDSSLEATVRVRGHALGLWKRLRFRFGF